MIARNAGAYTKPFSTAVDERREAPEQSGGLQLGSQRKRQAGSSGIRNQLHFDGVEAVDVAGSVVDCVVEFNGVGAAVGEGQEGVTGCVGDGGAETAEFVGANAVFEFIGESGKILERAGTGLVQGADGEYRQGLRLGLGYGERSNSESHEDADNGGFFH